MSDSRVIAATMIKTKQLQNKNHAPVEFIRIDRGKCTCWEFKDQPARRHFHPTPRCDRNQSVVSTYLCVIALDDRTALASNAVWRHVPPLVGSRHMRFVLVNGRAPRSQSFCATCCEPIEENYLREIATRLSYCDRNCYLGRGMGRVSAPQNRVRAS
jgi:hypothetical protein